MNDKHAEELAIAISHWIGYQILCGREKLLSEMYLGIPLGEFLISKNKRWLIESEWDHPNFKDPNKSRKGRPKQIDFVIKSSKEKRALAAIEVKWIRNIVTVRQNIINDILRLECLRYKGKPTMRRYLVLAGFTVDFDKLQSIKFNNDGKRQDIFFQKFFSTNDEMKINIHNCLPGLRAFFKEFSISHYDANLPKTLSTNKIYFKKGTKYTVGIWKVNSVQNRSSFMPGNSWCKGLSCHKQEEVITSSGSMTREDS